MNPRIVAIVGMPGSGKSLAAAFFKTKGIPVVRFGSEIENGVRELEMEVNEKNERMVREKMRRELGMAAVAIKVAPKIIDAVKTHSFIVLDGLYSWEEYMYLKEQFPQLLLLCVFAPPEMRYKRLESRKERPLNRVEAESRDTSEIENLHKGGPIARADYLIKNESTKELFEGELEKFYSSLV